MNSCTMQDQELINDLLASEKMLTGTYNTFTNECATQQVRDEFLNLLNEEHQMQADVFSEMKKRGWYPTPAAQQQMIDQARQKFQNAKP
ncbi:MAG: spore coat protein [Clostridiales bacterium]|jgi:spore coat protein CotF|nr:spore coat protein [Clostridiales bacterium]